MVDVFESRPNDLSQNYQEGLEGFLGLLGDQALNPRTLGITDFSVEQPLDAALKLMTECSGAVILGFPQTTASTDGKLGETVKLPSAWNQIEATLAQVQKLPMMIVTHPGVDRGIFDRGTTGRFVFTEDLGSSGWPLTPQIRGGLKSWVQLVKSESERNTERASTAATVLGGYSISNDVVQVLAHMAGRELGTVYDIGHYMQVSQAKAQYFIDELSRLNFLGIRADLTGPTMYYLQPDGRKYLFENGILE